MANVKHSLDLYIQTTQELNKVQKDLQKYLQKWFKGRAV